MINLETVFRKRTRLIRTTDGVTTTSSSALRVAEVGEYIKHAGFNSPTLWVASDKRMVLPSFCKKRLNTSRALPRGSLFGSNLRSRLPEEKGASSKH